MRPGKTPVSCVPCAKRKVKCDKQLPCCHCKRRPQDACHYPTPISAPEDRVHELDERIHELERHIRRLGGDPNAPRQVSGYPSPASDVQKTTSNGTVESCSSSAPDAEPEAVPDPSSLVADDAGAAYIEAPMWYSFGDIDQSEDDSQHIFPRGKALPPSSARTSYHPSILDPISDAGHTRVHGAPIPTSQLEFLWNTYLKNVHPLTKIFFDWEIEPMIHIARDADPSLSNAERALVFSIIFMSTNSLSEEQCTLRLGEDQARLLDRFQQATENALHVVGYASTTNKTTLQALILYVLVMTERANPTTAHSLIGIANRIAERMGLHRDGALLGLGPLRAEERRRMWWQLQYLEIIIARYVGTMSATIFANWDARMPANIEDADISPETETMPPERVGLTEISACLWCYQVLSINRSLAQPRGGEKSMAWALSPRIPLAEKDALIDKVESDLRIKYLQYCEPLIPLHVQLQLSIYQYVLAGRRVMRHPALVNAKISEMPRSQRDDFLAVCTKSLEYGNMAQTNEALKGYLWHNRGFFPWVALVHVVLESHHRSNEDEAASLWALLRTTYSAYPELCTAAHRHDITLAARITVASWKKYAAYMGTRLVAEQDEAPSWILELCDNFEIPRPRSSFAETDGETFTSASEFFGIDFDFDNMDWSSWDDGFVNYATIAQR